MINLLPPEVKRNFRFARRNIVLRKWVVMSLASLLGLGVIITYGLFSLHQSTVRYNKMIVSQGLLADQKLYDQTQTEVKDISNTYRLVIQVLSKEILFSALLKQIGATIPTNSSLTGLNISKTTGAIDITAMATDYNTATQVQVNLSDPANKIFTKADLVSINCGGGSSTDSSYPCTVDVRAQFGSNNPFLFINQGVSK